MLSNYYLLDRLQSLLEKHPFSAHTPGHKNGHHLPSVLKELWGESFASYDLTEIDTLDNLHFPTGCIAESQNFVARTWQAKASYYLVNGTSVGLQAAIMATCHNKQVFVPRHAHRSIYHSLILAQAEPIYLPVTLDSESGLPLGVSVETFEEYLKRYPLCKTLVMVNPTYQGITWQNKAVCLLAKAQGLQVIVDEAHGSHLHFSAHLPPSLLDLGADLVVQSWHKTLPVLTQGSVLQVGESYQGLPLDHFLSLLQTTSPSYLLLSSLEAGGVYMAEQGQDVIGKALGQLSRFYQCLDGFSTINRLYDPTWHQDPFKLYLCSSKLSGWDLADTLVRDYAIYPEMSDSNGTLLLLPLAVSENELQVIGEALRAIELQTKHQAERPATPAFYTSRVPQQALGLAEAFWRPKVPCFLGEATGKIAGQFLIKYPPGIPMVAPGEIIDAEVIRLWVASGGDLAENILVIL